MADDTRSQPVISSFSNGPPRKGRLLLPALLLLIYAAECAWFIGTQSLIFD
jgi:hypothetical protein